MRTPLTLLTTCFWLLSQAVCAQFVLTRLPQENTLGRPELLNYGSFDPYQEVYHPTDLAVQISADGKRFVTLANTGALTVYEMGKGPIARAMGRVPAPKGSNIIAQAIGKAATPLCAAFSPDSRYVAAGSAEGVAFVWDLTTPVDQDNPIAQLMGLPPLATLTGHTGQINRVWFSPDGQQLLTGSLDSTLRFWQRTTGQLVKTISVASVVNDCCFSPDGKQIAVGTESGEVLVYTTATGQLKSRLKGHTKAVRSVAFHSSGDVLSGSDDKTVRTWDSQSGTGRFTYQWHTGAITQVAYVGDKPLFVTLGHDNTLNLWETTGDDEPIQRLPQAGSPYLSGFSSTGLLVVLSRPNNIYTLFKINR